MVIFFAHHNYFHACINSHHASIYERIYVFICRSEEKIACYFIFAAIESLTMLFFNLILHARCFGVAKSIIFLDPFSFSMCVCVVFCLVIDFHLSLIDCWFWTIFIRLRWESNNHAIWILSRLKIIVMIILFVYF